MNFHLLLKGVNINTPNLLCPGVLTLCLFTGSCEYDLDSYRTVFHPVGRGVSYANYRQRLEVKTFAFVSGDKALPGLVGDIGLGAGVVSA